MLALDSISISGFRSIANLEDIQLGPVNVLIGPNGSGKSNFIEVFSFLHALREGRLQDYVMAAGGADRLLHFGSKVTDHISIRLSFASGINRYEVEFKTNASDRLFVSREAAAFQGQGYSRPYVDTLAPRGQEAGISEPTLRGVPGHVRDHLGRWRLYHFHDTGRGSPLKKTADVNDNRYLQPNGSNLAAFLFLLRNRFPTEYDLVRRTVNLAAPFFDDFILEPDRLNEDKIRLEWRHKGSDAYFDAASFSDGTLRFIALATLLLQPQRFLPSVTIVDEPELGLHPYAIRLLASLIRQASSRTQVIISTQSTLLLDEFEPEDVLVANRVDRATVLTRLDPERLSSWLDTYSLGQLWEKNEIGGRPAVERG